MSEAHAEAHAEEHAHEHGHDINYFKVYITLLVLLVISVIGPMFEIQTLTLITAFGIACVKAFLVAKNFMHINLARRYVTYLVATCLVFMLLFFAGVAPDVMKAEGTNWEKPLWLEPVAAEATPGHGTAGH